MSATALRIVEGSSMDKTKALSAALSQIERQFGKGSVMKLGKNDRSMDIETISSGSLGLDIALGVGGLPRGRVVEIYGPESSGKTTLALHTVAEGQKKGGICAFIDAEHALDPVYARKLGVNIDELLISQPDTGEQALEICGTLVRSGAVKERDEVVGNQTRVKVVKNKLAPPFKQVEFDIMYGEGVSKMGEILDLGVKAGIVEKSGAWFSYDSQRLGQGRENSKAFLKANPDMVAKIETAIRQNSGLIAEQILAGPAERDADGEEPAGDE